MELKEQLREDKNMLNKIKIFGKKLLWTVWIVFLGLLLIPWCFSSEGREFMGSIFALVMGIGLTVGFLLALVGVWAGWTED